MAIADRRLRDDRRLPDGRAGGPRRLDRLALPAPVRLGGVFRRAAGHARERPLEDRAGRDVEVKQVSRRYRPGSLVLETEFTTASGVVRITDAMAIDSPTPTVARVVEGLRGEVPMRSELIDPVRLRLDRPLGRAAHERGISAIAGPDKLRLRSWVEHRGEGLDHRRRVHRQGGAAGPVHPGLAPVDRAAAAGLDAEGAIRDADAWWRAWSQPLRGPAARPRGRDPLADHPQGADLRADRRDRRRGDDLAPREARRRAQLGLPLLLAPRRDVHPAGAGQRRAISTRRAPGANGCSARWPAGPTTSRSCTAWPASGG